jgi:hypothetical protein
MLNMLTTSETEEVDYGKAYLPFALRENFIEILIASGETRIMEFKDFIKFNLLGLRKQIIDRFGNTYFIGRDEKITPEICNEAIDIILEDFCVRFGIQKLPITIDGISAVKMEIRQLYMDKTLVTFIKSLTTKLVFDIELLAPDHPVLSVLEYESLLDLTQSGSIIGKEDPVLFDRITTEFDNRHNWDA